MKNFIFKRAALRCWFLLFFCAAALVLPAQVVEVDCAEASTNFLGKHFGHKTYPDEVGVGQVRKDTLEPGEADVLNLGVTGATYWLYTRLVFTGSCKKYLQFEAQGIVDIDAYIFDGPGEQEVFRIGSNESPGRWPIKGHNYTLPLEGNAGDTLDLYLKVRSNQQLLIPVRLHSADRYWAINLRDNLIFGIYFGIILVMILYNFFLYVSVRDANYLYYIVYIASVGLAQASILGYANLYLWPDSPWLRENGILLFGGMSGVFTMLFVINFLKTARFTPLLHKVLIAFICLDIVAIALLILDYDTISFSIINLIAGVGSFVALITGGIIVRRGFVPAKFFVVAYSVFLLGVIVYVLKDYNILPYNAITARSVIFGSAVEIVLLSLALANRINVLTKEKEESQQRELRVSRENEKIIREQNIVLEQKVEERTHELQEANEVLSATLANLKDAQAQLVDAEKMASLGQLTAGIAHEINNPINFVTSNVKPLRRDIQELYELIDAYSNAGGDDAAALLDKAHALRDELDYDYLKEEIDSLVEGIAEGAGRTSEIVKGLRTFSRLDEDVVKLAGVHENLMSTMILLRNKLKDGVKVVEDYDPDLPDIECYAGKLNQVFMNILNNAIYAVQHKDYPEGEEPTIKLKTRKKGEEVVIHLIDNGVGMDEETRRKIFDPFFTTKDVGEGTGLGMSIVYKIIEKHNGRMEVQSELGKGTEFIITLPMRQAKKFE